MSTDQTSPYLLDEPPTSVGKALLARAFWHWCVLHHGHSDEEIVAALEPDGVVAPAIRRQISFAARLLGELIAAGEIRTFARPFGGGSPERVPASHWELDDFRQRFARSALNPKMPFAFDAEPTHWIFVELEDFNRIVEDSCADIMPTRRQPASDKDDRDAAPSSTFTAVLEDRHIRMPELERRTGMSRSTIYRRIEAGRFPNQIPMDGNIAVWWESEFVAWLANPR